MVEIAIGETADDARSNFEIEQRKAIDAERKRTGAKGRKPKVSIVRIEPLDAWLRLSGVGSQRDIEDASVNVATLEREIKIAGRVPPKFSFELLEEERAKARPTRALRM